MRIKQLKGKLENQSVAIRLSVWEAWMFGGIGLAFTLITIALEIITPELPKNYQILIIITSIITYTISTIFIYRYHQKDSPLEKSSQSIFPIVSEFRNDYHDHIEGLFKEIKKNLIPSIKDKNYFEALRKTQEKKHMILQHLRTMINRLDTDSDMFVMYQASITEFNDLEKRKKVVLREIEDYDEKLDDYDFGHNEGEWIDVVDFKKAVGIKRNDSLEDIFKDKELYNFPSSINCNLYVKNDGNEFKLGFAGNWFAKSKDKEKLEQFKNFIYENGQKIMHEVSSIHSIYGTIEKTSVVWFNKEFKERDEELEGQPILGSCRTCLGWFNIENQKKYKPILDVFNSSPSNYDETQWKKKESV